MSTQEALGLIEVRGYIGAIVAADAALKAASVKLIGCEVTKAALVTVKLRGDVGAIKSAVDTGAEEARKLGVLLTSHVIARIHEETAKILFQDNKNTDIQAKKEPMSKAANELAVTKDVIEPSTTKVNEVLTKVENKVESEVIDKVVIQSVDSELKEAINEIINKTEEDSEDKQVGEIGKYPSLSKLKGMKVEELRRLARSLNISSMTNKQIKFAKKDVLIEALSNYFSKEEA